MNLPVIARIVICFEVDMIERVPTTITAWVGRILSALVVLILLAGASVNLFAPQLLVAGLVPPG